MCESDKRDEMYEERHDAYHGIGARDEECDLCVPFIIDDMRHEVWKIEVLLYRETRLTDAEYEWYEDRQKEVEKKIREMENDYAP